MSAQNKLNQAYVMEVKKLLEKWENTFDENGNEREYLVYGDSVSSDHWLAMELSWLNERFERVQK